MPNVVVTRNTYPDAIALENVIHYVLDKAVVIGGYAVDCGSYAALEQMLFVKQAFRKSEALQLKHFFITFADNEMDLTDFDELLRLGFAVGQCFKKYQMVYGVHLDGSHVHMHFVMNTTSFVDGHQYSDGLSMFNRLCNMLRVWYPGFDVDLHQTRKYTRDVPYCMEDVGVFQRLT